MSNTGKSKQSVNKTVANMVSHEIKTAQGKKFSKTLLATSDKLIEKTYIKPFSG